MEVADFDHGSVPICELNSRLLKIPDDVPSGDGRKEEHAMRKIGVMFVAVAVLALLGGSLLGCNTVKGVGKDIKRGGQAVENAADRVQN